MVLEGLEHHRFCYELYQIQNFGCRYFVLYSPFDTSFFLPYFTPFFIALYYVLQFLVFIICTALL